MGTTVMSKSPPVANPEAFVADERLPGLWHMREPDAGLPYSDGDALEERLLRHFLSLPQTEDPDLAGESLIENWPSQYHCAPARRNLLRPVLHLLRGRVLEIGAGCGALTGLIAATASEIVAIEGAPRRARITAARHRNRSNLTILDCPLDRFQPSGLFDTVVVVGVLEYAPTLMAGGRDAPLAFLNCVRSMLVADGVLLLAIENQLGLSYIGGQAEDHVGRAWIGVEDRYGESGFRTFGRLALAHLLTRAGLPGQSWYYPFPDYKLPQLVLADAAQRAPELDLGDLVAQIVPDRRYRPAGPGFVSALAWKSVGDNRLLDALADSFLVAATPAQMPPPTDGGLVWVFATGRRPAFRKATGIRRNGAGLIVERWRLEPQSPTVEGLVRQTLATETFQAGSNYLDTLRRVCATQMPDATTVVDWAQDWLAYLRAHASPAGTLPVDFLDCIPANLIRLADGDLFFFDREWLANREPTLARVIYRGLYDALNRMSFVLPPELDGPLLSNVIGEAMQMIGLPIDTAPRSRDEALLQAFITGENPASTEHAFMTGRLRAPKRSADDAPSPANLPDLRAAAALHGFVGRTKWLMGYVDGIRTDPDGGRSVFGWAWDKSRATPGDVAVLLIDGDPAAIAPICEIRSDAATAMGAECARLGFMIPLHDVAGPVSRHTALVMVWSDGRAGVLPWSDVGT
jgi:SAM-dependent methyltransferase